MKSFWQIGLVTMFLAVPAMAVQAQDAELDERADEALTAAQEKVDDVADQIDASDTAQETSAGLLDFIYQAAEYMSFSAFHWVAFALMLAGVISFGLQLVLGKLVVLAKGGFSLTEILSDTLGFLVSAMGLVLTTQAAAENSRFTQSPFAVLTATITGLLIGFLFYLWGQRAEIQAVKGRRIEKARDQAE